MKLNRAAFENLVAEDIEAIEKHFPEHEDKLERWHIIDILKDCVKFYYPNKSLEHEHD